MPRIATGLVLADRLGAWKARWGIGRLKYMVPPGLYAIGVPTPEAPVLVTASYKMSYDIVRSALAGRDVWLLVLETYGINVWCAAGKGTFGTEELVRRIRATDLDKVVSHRRLILPLLGAPGVAAHTVTKETGFNIRYGTIRASDLPAYLDNGMRVTPTMRELTFSFRERLALIPVELMGALKPTAIAVAALFLIFLALRGSVQGLMAVYAYLGAVAAGVVVTPLLLPWLPGRSFAGKGALVGLLWSAIFYALAGGEGWRRLVAAAASLVLPAISAFYALNFTGCTNFTSRTGVKKEMRLAMPVMGAALLMGALLMFAGLFL